MNQVYKFIFLATIGLSRIGAVSVSASVDAGTINLSDVFTLKVEAKDADNTPTVDISPLLKNFTIVSGPAQQTNIQWITGKWQAPAA